MLRFLQKNLRSQGRTPYYGLNELDRKIERWANFDGGYFVELGANDGLQQSNTAYFEKRRGWRGVLIEPAPHRFLECRRNRPESDVFCCACVGFEYTERFVEIEYANLMSVARGVTSDIEDIDLHLSRAEVHLPDNEVRFVYGALARPLGDILNEAASPDVIDLLSLDVEGAELEVLNGLDFSARRFRYMVIECRALDPLRVFLEQRGYILEEALSQHDYLFKNTELETA